MRKTIMCYGDSNTWGCSPLGGRHEEDTRWTGVLSNLLGDGYKVYEQGLNGRTTVFDDPFIDERNGKKFFVAACKTCYPLDLIIVMLGTNDLKTVFNKEPHDIALGLDSLLNKIKNMGFGRNGGEPKLLIISPIYVSDNILETSFALKFGLQARDKSHALAAHYERIAKLHNAYFMDASQYAQPSKEDGIHMMPDQHKLLGEAVYKKVTEIFAHE